MTGPLRAARPLLLLLLACATTVLAGCTSSNDVRTAGGTTSAAPAAGSVVGTSVAAGDASTGSTARGGGTGGTTRGTSAASSTSTTQGKGTSSTSGKSSTTVPPTLPPSSVDVAPEMKPFCTQVSVIATEFAGLDPTKDFAGYLAKVQSTFTDMLAVAPPEIKGDLQTIANALKGVTTLDQLENLDQDPAIDAATNRIDEFTTKTCGTKL